MEFSELRSREFLFILVLAGMIRIAFVASYHHQPVSDELDYLQLATSLADSGTYAIDGRPSAFRPPGYPAFLAGLQLIGIGSVVSIRTAQAVLDLGTLAGIFLLAIRFGRKATLAAGMLWALHPAAIIYSGLLLSETLTGFLVVSVVCAVTQWKPGSSSRFIPAIAGLAAGMLVLIKPWFILCVLLMIPFLKRSGRTTGFIVVFAVVSLLTIAPWILRNTLLFGSPLITTNTGVNLYVGNQPSATGAYKIGLSDTLLAIGHDEAEFNRRVTRLALQHIVDAPGEFLSRIPLKIAHIFRSEGELLVWAFHANLRDPETRFSEKYRSLSPWIIIPTNLWYVLVICTGILGFLAHRHDDLASFMLIVALVVAGVHSVFFGGARFHFPLLPFLVVLASHSLMHAREDWNALSTRWKILAILVWALLIVLWSLEFRAVFLV